MLQVFLLTLLVGMYLFQVYQEVVSWLEQWGRVIPQLTPLSNGRWWSDRSLLHGKRFAMPSGVPAAQFFLLVPRPRSMVAIGLGH